MSEAGSHIEATGAPIILATGSPKPQHNHHQSLSPITPEYTIVDFDPELHTTALVNLWNLTLPTWPIPPDRLTTLLTRPRSHHFLLYNTTHTLCAILLTHSKSPSLSLLTALLVAPANQSHGLGTALLTHAITTLSLSSDLTTISLSSGFPRFWPGLPVDLPAAREFFTNRGFVRTAEASARDLYQDIQKFEIPLVISERAAKAGMTYGPWTEEGVEECLEKQKRNFGRNADWVKAYEKLAAAKRYGDVMVIYDSAGRQIAWTLMCSPESIFCEQFAFMPMIGEKVGLIACVGVDKAVRGGGVGRLLLAAAMENLKMRGAKRVFIDWVVIRGYYEKLGFEVWREYEGFEFQVRS